MTAVSYGLSICFLYCNMLDWKSCQKQIGLKHDTKVWCQWVCHKSKKKQNPSVQIKSVQSPDSSTQSPNHSHTHPTVPAENSRRIIARFLNLSLLRDCAHHLLAVDKSIVLLFISAYVISAMSPTESISIALSAPMIQPLLIVGGFFIQNTWVVTSARTMPELRNQIKSFFNAMPIIKIDLNYLSVRVNSKNLV